MAAFICTAPLAFAQGPADSAALAEAASKPVLAGKVDLVEGDVRFFDKNRRRRLPRLGDPLYEGESIATGANGEVHLGMEDGGYIGVHLGEAVIRTPQGAVNVRPDQAGFVPQRGAVRPRVLDRVPDFFRPTRNEGRFAGLHERVHAQLDQRREERRQFIEQRRKPQLDQRGERKPAAEQRQEQRKLRQEQRRRQKTEDERAVEEQRREGLQKQREERREQAQKARLERALKGD